MDEISVKVAKIDERCKSNTHRIDELETNQQAVTELALSVRAMATDQSNMKTDLAEVKTDVKALNQKAGKRWDSVVDKLIWLAVGGALSWIGAQLF